MPAIRTILDVVQPRFMLCGQAHMFREAHTATSMVYALNQLKDEYYIFDTARWALERFPVGGQCETALWDEAGGGALRAHGPCQSRCGAGH